MQTVGDNLSQLERASSHIVRWFLYTVGVSVETHCWSNTFMPFLVFHGLTSFLFLYFFRSLALCENRPKIIEEVSGTIERNLGENATLDCKVNNPDGFVVSWVKLNRDNPSDQTVLSYDENLVVKPRLKMSVTPSRDKFSLEVNFVLFYSSTHTLK